METGIYKKLLTVQEKLKAPKSQYNDFGKYNYRNCEDILEAVKPILTKINAALIITDTIINIQQRFYVEATAKFIDADTGESTEVKAYAREDETKKGMDGSQITGSSSSYARKYALNGLFLIDDTKDSDTLNKGDTPKTHENVPKTPTTSKGTNTPTTSKCEGCGAAITEKVAMYSISKFGKKLCFDCQKKASVKR